MPNDALFAFSGSSSGGISTQTDSFSETAAMSGAEIEVRNRISRHGPITFAEFMELALYHPEGYYSQDPRIGARGDYFTSPILHPAFGALIAVQLRTMWDTLGKPSTFWVIEPGAGGGRLAADILSFAETQMSRFARALRYVELDRSASATPTTPHDRASRLRTSGIPLRGITGCILSNELFDAFPVHRFRIADGQAQEMYVSLDADGRFRDSFAPPSARRIADRLAELPRRLPNGFRGEVNLAIDDWMSEAAASLHSGYILTIDYGYEAAELYSDARARGTFQTYYKHVDGISPYQRIGRQDMTAHVDFSALIQKGREAGLRPVFLTTQTEFLKSLGFDAMAASLQEQNLARSDRLANLRAMSELADPRGLGRFRTLVQEKNTGIERSSQLLPDAERLAGLQAPTMTADHLYAAQNPSLSGRIWS